MKLFYNILFCIFFINLGFSQCDNKILFIVDDSGSIDSTERQDMQDSIQLLSDQLYAQNPLTEIAIVQYGQPIANNNSQPSYYITSVFTVNPTIIIPDDPGGNSLIQDVLPNSIDNMVNDGLFGNGGVYEEVTSIFIFTDANIGFSCNSVLSNCSSCTVPTQSCGYDYLLDLSVSLDNIPISVFRVLGFFSGGTADGIQQNGGVLIEDNTFLLSTQQIDDLTDSLICIQASYETLNTCIGETTQFNLITDDIITSALWDFGDGSSTSTDLNPAHIYTSTGTFTITLTLTSNGDTLTNTSTITIYEIPIANTIPDYITCDDVSNNQTELFDLSTRDQFILGSQNATNVTINYFVSLDNANNNINPLNTNYNNITNNQDVFARIENNDNNNCYNITTFKLIVDAQPIANTASNFMVCDNASNSGIASFNLQLKNDEILNGQSSTTFSITYYLTNNDAINNINALPTNYTSTSSNQIIFAKIYNLSNPDCYDITSFNIITNQLPIANTASDFVVCEENSNGTASFNLLLKNTEILNGQSSTAFSITYYLTNNDAVNNINALPTNYTSTSSNQIIFAKIYNVSNPDCYDITSFNIITNQLPVANSASNLMVCDDDSNDGIASFNLQLKNTEILNGQSSTTFNINYYLTNNDAINNINALPTNYTSTSSNQIIFAKIYNVSNLNCYAITNFNIIINQLPIANTVNEYIKCENDLDLINLNQFSSTVLGTQNSADFLITYYTSETDAINGENQIISDFDYDQPTTIYVKNENSVNSNCYAITTIQLSIYEFPFLDTEELENCSSINFTIEADINQNEATYLWENGETSSSIIVNGFGVYNVEITIDNCSKIKSFIFFKPINCEIPQGISPNNDGLNDYFDVSFLDIDTIVIFNRYGTKVYNKNNYSKEWNGQSNKGDHLPSGTYYYVIRTKTDEKTITGWVYLVR